MHQRYGELYTLRQERALGQVWLQEVQIDP